MTKRKAKSLSLKVWRWLAAHPEAKRKDDLPPALLSQIEDPNCRCPLCAIHKNCGGCPLRPCMELYTQWSYNEADASEPDYANKRHAAAEAIVRKIEAWEVK